MWKVYCDDYLLYNSALDDYKIFNPALDLELNKTGSFEFTIYSNHPNYDKLQKLKSIIQVFQDDYLYFRGRILNDTVGFHNERQVSCEGELAFLLDSIQRPFSFPESGGEATPKAYFTYLIAQHNTQVDAAHQFIVGNVTVTDANDYISRSDMEYSTTWELINQGLINTHGGYLWVRHETTGNYIDYLSDFTTLGNQSIKFGVNLLDLATERKGEDVATIIVPLGNLNEETNERVTISDLEDEETDDICKSGDCVYSKVGIQKYGKICKKFTWDAVTINTNLLIKAKAQLAKSILQEQTIELNAADLSAAGQDFNSFHLGNYVSTSSKPHEDAHSLASTYLVKKLSIKLDDPASNVLTVGATIYTFTEENRRQQEEQWQRVETNVTKTNTQAIRELEQRTNSAILQNNTQILTQVSEGYYTKDKTDELVSGVSTQLEQTSSSFEFRFSNLEQNVQDVQNGTDASFTEIRKYIRFVDGNIILGEEGNELTLKIQNDRISFIQNALEVAYFSDRKLYVTDGDFLNSLRLGNFSFIPRANGNLTFKKVT